MSAQPKLKPTASFDPIAARADFEILSREVYGKPLVYLDSAASAQKPRHVLDAMRDFAASDYANVHRGVHYLSAAATERYEGARETVRTFLSAAHADEIVFTKGGTEAINLVSYSYLSPLIQPGDEIVLTVMEHHSNIVPWHFLRERQGAVLKWVDVRDDGSLDIEAAIVAHIHPFEHRALPLAQEMPGHDVGVMFHHRQHDLVPRLDQRRKIAVGDQIDRLDR